MSIIKKEYGVSLLLSILIYSILMSLFLPQTTASVVTLTANGDRNELSKGGEVWLTGIEINGQKARLDEYQETGKWKRINGNIVYVPDQSGENLNLVLHFPNASDVCLVFNKHKWSGIVKIQDGEKYSEMDLYDFTGEVKYQVENVIPFEYSVTKIILSGLLIIFLAFLILRLLGFSYISSKRSKRRVTVCGFIFWAIMLLLQTFNIKYLIFDLLLGILVYKILYKSESFDDSKLKKYMALWGMILLCWFYQIIYMYKPLLASPWIVYTVLAGLYSLLVIAPGKGGKLGMCLATALSPILTFGIIEVTSNAKWQTLSFSTSLINIIILAICSIIIINIFDYKKLGYYLVYFTSFFLSIANYYVIQFKKFALMPSDMLQLRTAAAVAGDYQYNISTSIVMGFLLLMTSVVLTYLYIPNADWKLKEILKRKVIAFCAIAGLVLWTENVDFTQAYDVVKNDWDTSETYSQSGFALSFISYMQTMYPKKPEGYSLTRVSEILEPYSVNETSSTVEKPVIIVIMNESFSDLRVWGDLKNTENVMGFLDSYDGFLEKGNTYVSVRGGGTCNSEFEFLTGNSMKYFSDTYPYTQFDFEGIPTLVTRLKEEGYKTVAMHPANPTNYKRQAVYKQMGFDQFYSVNDYADYENLFLDRMSDHDNYQELIKVVDSTTEPLFIFNVTLQNHGEYNIETLNPQNPLDLVNVDTAYSSFKDLQMFLSLINESNKALESLIKHFEQEERPVIICFFGDHQPGCLDPELEKSVFEYDESQSELANNQRNFATPYFFWSNYDTEVKMEEAAANVTSPNYLASRLLNYAGLPMSAYEKFLWEMQQNIWAANRFGYLGNDGVWYQYEGESPYSGWIDDYQILQYYHMFHN